MYNTTTTIVVTNYNYSKFLPRCLRSCLNQNNKSKVILVDDASDDADKELLKLAIKPFLGDSRLSTILREENGGVSAAANTGIEDVSTQYFVRVDADDFITSNMCGYMSEYLEANHDAFGVACDYYLVDNYENLLKRKDSSKNPISCGIMYRRDLFLYHGGYNEKMRHREEEELRKRIGEYYSIHHLKMPFYRYRMHDTNKTKTKEYEKWKI